jgi:hypothetical protein
VREGSALTAQGLRAGNLGLVVGNGRSVRTHGWMRRQVVVAGVGGSSSMLLVRGLANGSKDGVQLLFSIVSSPSR